MYKIALDAGHGINTEERRIPKRFDENETREWQLNSRVCRKIQRLLSEYEGCEVIRLDDENGGELNVPLSERVLAANSFNADAVISIHHNIGIKGGNGGGISAFSYTGSQESARLRDDIYARLIEHTGLAGNRAEPLKESNFYILKYTNAPAALFELGFMDSAVDAPVIITEEYAESCARAIADTIVLRFGLEKRKEDSMDKRYDTIDEVPAWARETVKKLMDMGALKGGDKGLNLSEDMLRILVITDRAGAFE